MQRKKSSTVTVTAVLQASKYPLEAQRARRRRTGGALGARRGGVGGGVGHARHLSEGIDDAMTWFCILKKKITGFSKRDRIADQRSPRRIRKPHRVATG